MLTACTFIHRNFVVMEMHFVVTETLLLLLLLFIMHFAVVIAAVGGIVVVAVVVVVIAAVIVVELQPATDFTVPATGFGFRFLALATNFDFAANSGFAVNSHSHFLVTHKDCLPF